MPVPGGVSLLRVGFFGEKSPGDRDYWPQWLREDHITPVPGKTASPGDRPCLFGGRRPGKPFRTGDRRQGRGCAAEVGGEFRLYRRRSGADGAVSPYQPFSTGKRRRL